jgi:SAM-dependent methyltransferase
MKTRISNLLRNLGILLYTDKIRFYLLYLKKIKDRNVFINKNPDVALPPAYLIYESFDLNYESYYTASKNTASWLLNHFRQYCDLKNINILDWGCGPARIIRHLPELLDNSCSIYGTDYNAKSIEWCKKSIVGVNFNLNSTI